MKLLRNPGEIEFYILGICILFYVLYLVRIWRISKVLPASYLSTIAKLVLRTVYVGLFIFVALGPSLDNPQSNQEAKVISKDIFMALDLSNSMNANDVVPTRLERSKYTISKIVKELAGEKMGLVVFSSDAFLQCPLTVDRNALNLYLEISNSNIVPHGGTDLYKPLKLALDKHKQNKKVKNQSKVIILFSDGEDFGDNMEEMASQIEDEGIKIFTVGVGSLDGTILKIGNKVKVDQNGEPVKTALNEKALKKLAHMTKGKYYEITPTRNETEKLINDIKNIKGQLSESRNLEAQSKNLRYELFLGLALILMTIDVMITFKVFKL